MSENEDERSDEAASKLRALMESPSEWHRVLDEWLAGAPERALRLALLVVPWDAAWLDWLAACPADLQDAYWSSTHWSPWTDDLEVAGRSLAEVISRGRVELALEVLLYGTRRRVYDPIPFAPLIRRVLDAVDGPPAMDRATQYDVEFAFDVLEETGTPAEVLVTLSERWFVRLGDRWSGLPDHVGRRLSESPEYAARVVCACFARDGQPEVETELGAGFASRGDADTEDAALRSIGRAALRSDYRLFRLDDADAWADRLMSLCRASGHVAGGTAFVQRVLGQK